MTECEYTARLQAARLRRAVPVEARVLAVSMSGGNRTVVRCDVSRFGILTGRAKTALKRIAARHGLDAAELRERMKAAGMAIPGNKRIQ
jgi:hypothetical protein